MEVLEVGLKPGRVVGQCYRLVRIIGTGGMGQVWAAQHTRLDTPVAIKVLLPKGGADPSAARRFAREARVAAELRSPHVVHVYDCGVDPLPFMVMELLEGETLRELLNREKRLSLTRVARLISQAAHALRLAEIRGIVHRDIKPSNLFLARFADQQVLKVLDFGIARLQSSYHPGADEVLTSSGLIVGSLPYLSPEQTRGDPLDFRTDLWALAVVAFRAVTGVDPFGSGNAPDTLLRISTGSRPRASALCAELPAALDDFFVRALAVDPKGRFSSARELADALIEIASDSTHPGQLQAARGVPEVLGAERTSSTRSWHVLAPTSAAAGPKRRARALPIALSLCLVAGGGSLAWRRLKPPQAAAPPSVMRVSADVPTLRESLDIPPNTAATAREPASALPPRNEPPARPPTSLTTARSAPARVDALPETHVEVDPIFGLPFRKTPTDNETPDRSNAARPLASRAP